MICRRFSSFRFQFSVFIVVLSDSSSFIEAISSNTRCIWLYTILSALFFALSNLNQGIRQILSKIHRWQLAPFCHHILDKLFTFFNRHLSSLHCIIQEINRSQISDLLFFTILLNVFQIAATDDIVGITAIGHTSTLTFAKSLQKPGIFDHHLPCRIEFLL